MKKKASIKTEEQIERFIKEESDWFVAFTIGAILFSAILYYHYIRRGIINPFSKNNINSLLLINKSFAISAIFLIGLSFIIGPLAKFFDYFKSKVRYRKEIGIMGFLFSAVHIVISLFFLENNFTKIWFVENQTSILLGIFSVAILLIVTFVSNNFAIRKLGYKKWIFAQRLAYLAFILATLHFILLGKIKNWTEWTKTLEPIYPPGTLIALIFVIIVLLIRIIVLFLDKKNKKAI